MSHASICSNTFYSFTSRITELMNVLDDLNRGRYERSMVSASDKDKTAESESSFFNLQLTYLSHDLLLTNTFKQYKMDTEHLI